MVITRRKRTLFVMVLSLLFVTGLLFSAGDGITKNEKMNSRLVQSIRELVQVYPRLNQGERITRLEHWLRRWVITERYCRSMMGNYWFTLIANRRRALIDAVSHGLAIDVATWWEKTFPDAPPRIEVNFTTPQLIRVLLHRGKRTWEVQVRLDRTGVVRDIVTDHFSIARHHEHYALKMMKRYPFAFVRSVLAHDNRVIIEDFELTPPGHFPNGWHWLPRDNNKKKLYTVVEENGNRYLKARDRGASVIIGKRFRWNVYEYPYLSWRWRVHALPPGGDVRYTKTNDSAAGVYVTFSRNFLGIPKSIKYVWSTTLPVGTTTRRKGIGRPWVIVARSGKPDRNGWYTEIFNVLEAYRKIFGEDPPRDALAIGVLTDANSTRSYAEADYDDFILYRKANAKSGILKFVPAGK